MTSTIDLSSHMPTNPIMQQAWLDCLHWAVDESEILARFGADTRNTNGTEGSNA